MIRFNEESIRFTPTRNTGIIRYRGTTIDWGSILVDTNKEWCTVTNTKETSTEGILTISVEANNTNEDRTALVRMYANDTLDGEQQYIIEVNQEGNSISPYFNINPVEINIDSAEQYFYTTYEAYRVNDIVATINADWIVETDPFRYKADYNPTLKRSATIDYTAYFDNGTIQRRTLTVTQTGTQKQVILSKNVVVTDYNEQTVLVTADIEGLSTFSVLSSDIGAWADVNVDVNDDVTFAQISIAIQYNQTNFNREGSIKLGDDDISVVINVSQKANVYYLEFPIWKDTTVSFEGNTLYKVFDGDKLIYQGRTYGGDVYINRILKSYVEDNVDITSPIEFGGRFMSNNSYKTFKIQIPIDGEYTDYYIVRTYLDYSYENTDNHQLSKPISTILDDRQIFLFTGLNSYKDDSQTLMFQNYTPHPHISGGITRYFQLEKGIYTYMYDKLVPSGVIVDYSGDVKYFKVKRTCAKYACYYLNKYGGWDSMLFVGRSTKESAANTISQFKKDVDNSTKEFQYTDYQRVKKISYKLNTNYLTDAQSAMMHNLLDSNKVYLHNLETGEIFPVTIVTNSYEVKTYFNQKRKLYTYTIDFTKSQEQVIR